MAHFFQIPSRFRRRASALDMLGLLGAALVAPPAWSQTAAALPTVSVSAKAAPVLDAERADLSVWGVDLARTPQSVTVLGADLISATGVRSWSQALRLDASLADSYNTTGYVESLSVRGFVLDQGGNFLRNGLASSNFAPLAMENKERIEVLKGVAGLQSGVSAPGGLVNLVTKTPQPHSFHTALFATDARGGSLAHLDSNWNWGALGLRMNIASEALHPAADHAEGARQFASLALALPLGAATTLAADLEYHHKRQPSVPGLGLLDTNGDGVGETLPANVDPRLNLNHQTWTQPFDATTSAAQLALQHRLGTDWRVHMSLGTQRTLIDDRLAFPDGCGAAPNYVYPGLCANGDVDVYDYRSEGEERQVDAWEARLQGRWRVGGVAHDLRWTLSGHKARTRMAPLQAYNWVGTTNIYQPVALPADATLTELNTFSDERSQASMWSLTSPWTAQWSTFIGLRATRLERQSARSDGSRALDYAQSLTTPWAGLSWTPTPDWMAYASWGEGVELEAVPNRPDRFANAGALLPALKSVQREVGLKWTVRPRLLLTAAAFQIDKPYAADLNQAAGLPLRVAGAKVARHDGVELTLGGRVNERWSVQASATWLDARTTQAIDPSLVGQRVGNVARLKTALFADYKLVALPGLALYSLWTSEQGKNVSADGSVTLPDFWQVDAGLRYQHRIAGFATQWRLQIDNLTDRRYWREAPTQYWGGVYLFAAAPRSVRASVSVDL